MILEKKNVKYLRIKILLSFCFLKKKKKFLGTYHFPGVHMHLPFGMQYLLTNSIIIVHSNNQEISHYLLFFLDFICRKKGVIHLYVIRKKLNEVNSYQPNQLAERTQISCNIFGLFASPSPCYRHQTSSVDQSRGRWLGSCQVFFFYPPSIDN